MDPLWNSKDESIGPDALYQQSRAGLCTYRDINTNFLHFLIN
jgi:hypothetical protein